MNTLFVLLAMTALGTQSAPHIDLFTMGQGTDVYERFGHTAICVVDDTSPAASLCYNWGTTDFALPTHVLTWNYLRSTAQFWVSTAGMKKMLRMYVHFDRTVYRQRLPLTDDQARALAQRLKEATKEENRYYHYHHLHDNCSTRVRDFVDEAMEGALSRDSEPTNDTYRSAGRPGLAELTPLLLATDFLVGRGADQKLTRYDRAFLPDYLREEVTRRLGVEPEVIYERKGPPFPQEVQSGRQYVVLAGFLLAGLLAVTRLRGRVERLTRALAGAALGLLGLALWAVAIVSTVPELRYNEALLLFLPTDLLLPFLGTRRLRTYSRFRLAGLLLFSALLAVGVFKQPLFAALLLAAPVFLALLIPARERVVVLKDAVEETAADTEEMITGGETEESAEAGEEMAGEEPDVVSSARAEKQEGVAATETALGAPMEVDEEAPAIDGALRTGTKDESRESSSGERQEPKASQ